MGAAIGGVLQFWGNIINSGEQAEQYHANQDADNYNAALYKKKAEDTRDLYNAKEDAQRQQYRIMAGSQRAAIAQSGVGFGGSNLDIERQSQQKAELDALNIRYEGSMMAHGFDVQSQLYQMHSRAVGGLIDDVEGWKGWFTSGAGAVLSGVGTYNGGGSTVTGNDAGSGNDGPRMMGSFGSAAPSDYQTSTV